MSPRAELAGAKRRPVESRGPLKSTNVVCRSVVPRVLWELGDDGDGSEQGQQPATATRDSDGDQRQQPATASSWRRAAGWRRVAGTATATDTVTATGTATESVADSDTVTDSVTVTDTVTVTDVGAATILRFRWGHGSGARHLEGARHRVRSIAWPWERLACREL
jgi:hypothetical protein